MDSFRIVVLASLVLAWAGQDRPAEGASQDYSAWQNLSNITVGHGYLDSLDVSPDEKLVLVMSVEEACVRVYDRVTEDLVGLHSVEGYVEFGRGAALFWPAAGDRTFFAFAGDKGIFLYDAMTGAKQTQLSDRPAWDMRFSPDRSILVANLSDIDRQSSVLTFYPVADGPSLGPARTLKFLQRVEGWDLDSKNQRLAVSFYPTNDLQLLDAANGRPLWSIPGPQFSNSVDISSDDALVAVAGESLLIVEAKDPSSSGRFTEFENNVDTIRFSPSGDAIVATDYDGHARILSTRPGEEPLTLLKDLRHRGGANVYGCCFYSDGARLITSSGDQTIRFWGQTARP